MTIWTKPSATHRESSESNLLREVTQQPLGKGVTTMGGQDKTCKGYESRKPPGR